MTLAEAEVLAERLFAAIDRRLSYRQGWEPLHVHFTADRERVASDLAGLRRHAGSETAERDCGRCFWSDGQQCDDRDRYAGGLRRTAALYGETP